MSQDAVETHSSQPAPNSQARDEKRLSREERLKKYLDEISARHIESIKALA